MTRRTNTEAILHLQPNRSTYQPTTQPTTQPKPPSQPPKAAAKPATKPRERPNAGRAPKKGAGAARPAPKGRGGGDEGGEGDGDAASAAAVSGGGAEAFVLAGGGSTGGATSSAIADGGSTGGPTSFAIADGGSTEGPTSSAIADGGSTEGAATFVISAGGSSEGAAAFARRQAEIDALPRDQVRRLSVYVPNAVVLVLGALPKMVALRDAMRATFVDPPFALLDNLRDYALAAAYAHARALPHEGGQTRVRALLNEAVPLRARMLSSAETLVTFGLLDPLEVSAVRRGTGHVDTAQDLSSLSGLLRDAGPEILAKTPLTGADLARADELSALLLEALGHRQSGADRSGDPNEADDRVAKAYELMARAYDQCRRVVAYLRWDEGDADAIAPPLGHSRRRARRKQGTEPDGGAIDAPEPAPGEAGEGEADGG
ncbi:MAG TPA: hypothetical protein VFS43_25480 [Polyangiaceae bacterium]|nr:hypothetical protein [Polyangiaceae bacterium]